MVDHVRTAAAGRRAGWAVSVLLAAGIVVCLASCGSARTIDAGTLATLHAAFDEEHVAAEPLCIREGPFPLNSFGSNPCANCPSLAEAGFLFANPIHGGEEGLVQYSLTDAGRKQYRFDADQEFVELVRQRYTRAGRTDPVDAAKLGTPRLCFGKTRFHGVVDSLAPMSLTGNTYLSVKLVAEAFDTTGLLFDPRVATLGLDIPEKPVAGQPILYAPRVVTFEFVHGDPLPTTSSMRYGAWADAP